MNHLEFSFFLSTQKITLDIPQYKWLQISDFFLGHFSDNFNIQDDKQVSISFETLSVSKSQINNTNAVTIDGNTLKITGSDMNTQAIYYIHIPDRQFFAVFNDLYLARFLLQATGIPVIYDAVRYSENLAFFQHVNRLCFGEIITVRKSGNTYSFEKNKFSDILSETPQNYTLEVAQEDFFEELNKSVNELTNNEENINISLSGGIDSGTIAYLLKQNKKTVNAYTLSTDWGDEYLEAKETAGYLGIDLVKIHITKEEIVAEVPNVIRYFAFINPETIEIALIAFCLYKKLYTQTKLKRTFVTGYGSDLLNAGIFSPFSNDDELWKEISNGLRKTQISNEFSNLSALHYGIRVKHPYWSSNVILASLRTPARYKVVDNKDKYFFRKMMEGRLPEKIAWRKKTGAHHGTGLSTFLRKEFEIPGVPNSYQSAILDMHKNIFCNEYNYK
jgi:asparagine synthetase B (glutamine-hydrolysing)